MITIKTIQKLRNLFPILLLLTTLIFIISACSSKDKSKKLTVTANKTIMLSKDYQAKMTIKTNFDDAKFTVTKGKKTYQSGSFNSKKEASLSFKDTGEYTLTVNSNNESISKKISVTPYTVKVDKSTTPIDNTQYTITKIVYEKVKKSKEPSDDAENNMRDYALLNDYYYRATIYYELRNNGSKAIDLSYTFASPIDDSGKDYPLLEGNTDAYSYDSMDGVLQPNTRRTGYFVMISNSPFTLNHLKINISSYYGTDSDIIGEGGISELDYTGTSSSTTVDKKVPPTATEQNTDYSEVNETTYDEDSYDDTDTSDEADVDTDNDEYTEES